MFYLAFAGLEVLSFLQDEIPVNRIKEIEIASNILFIVFILRSDLSDFHFYNFII